MARGQKIPVRFMGRDFNSIADACAAYNIPHSTFRQHYHEGRVNELESQVIRYTTQQKSLPLEGQAIPADPADTRMVVFHGSRVMTYMGVATVPSYVTDDDFKDWIKNQTPTTDWMECTSNQWIWGICEGIDDCPENFQGVVLGVSSDDIPRVYDENSKPRGELRPAGEAKVTLVMNQHWPIPDVPVVLAVREDQDGARWVSVGDRIYHLPGDNRIVVQKKAAA